MAPSKKDKTEGHKKGAAVEKVKVKKKGAAGSTSRESHASQEEALEERRRRRRRILREQDRFLRRWVLEAVVSARVMRQLHSQPAGADPTVLTEKVLRSLIFEEGIEAIARVDTRRRLSDKYAIPTAIVPCSENIEVCRGGCCYRPGFPLQLQDVYEEVVRFSLDDPYIIRLADDGYCIHFDKETYRCKIREQRPAICRAYSCLRVKGMWEDFHKKIPGPRLRATLERIKRSSEAVATKRTISSVHSSAVVHLDTTSYHVFKWDDDHLLFDVSTANIMRILPVAHDILRDGGDGTRALSKYPQKKVRLTLEEIQRLKRTGHFQSHKIPGPEERQVMHEELLWGHHPFALFFYVSQKCNMRCAYCYAENNGCNALRKLATFPQARRAVDHLVRASGERSNLIITFFGGEPLLNFPVIEATVKYCRALEKEKGKKFSFRLSTNGTLLSRRIISFLVRHRFAVQVTLDGPPEVHDRFRPMRDGSSSHSAVLKSAQALCGAFADSSSVRIRANLHRHSPPVENIISYLEECGFGEIVLAKIVATPSGNSDLTVTPEQEEQFFAWHVAQMPRFLQSLQEGERLPYDPWSRMLKGMTHKKHVRGPFCGVARNSAAVSRDGTIYPCHRFVGMEGFALGNVRSGLDRERVMQFYEKCADTASLAQCSKCWARPLCLGRCPWERAVPGGKFIPSPGRSCQHVLQGLEATIYLFTRVAESFPRFFVDTETGRETFPGDGARRFAL